MLVTNFTNFFEVSDPISSSSEHIFKAPQSVIISIFIVSLILALVFFAIYIKISLPKMRQYKQEQLEDYKNENPRKKNVSYKNSGLYLPSWERAKYNSPLFLSVLFAVTFVLFLVAFFIK
ncbi:hypothetical protein [Mycoplasma buteonis]|uniref:hypothetical protein n=1 Tax=Mycoplasma buteonis TaxID=171280 RepID=UPI00068D4323|nr:hypothetical protein [Mycoplasma buteonis]